MPTITQQPDSAMFRTATVHDATSLRVDRKAKIIYGAALMQTGPVNDSRPWDVDDETLLQAQELAVRSNKGLKARLSHPNMSNDGIGTHLGRWRNIHIDGDTMRGDLHIADAAFTSPKGDLGTYVMDMAEEDPEAFGISLATSLDDDAMEATRNDDGRYLLRMKSVKAADVVDEPAATRSGFFSSDIDIRNLPEQATAFLDAYFSEASAETVRARVAAFLDNYLSNRGDDVTTETVEATETADEVTTEVVDETAAGDEVTDETTTATADLSVDPVAEERARCKKLRALCDMAHQPNLFNKFVDAGFSVAEAQDALKTVVVRKNTPIEDVDLSDEVNADPDAKFKAEYADMLKQAAAGNFSVDMTEEQYIKSRQIDERSGRIL